MTPLRPQLCILLSLAICPSLPIHCFTPSPLPPSHISPHTTSTRHIHSTPPRCRASSRLALSNRDDERIRIEEESRLKVLSDRRKTIRGVLKAAEGTRNFRLKNGYVPPLDPETNTPIKSDTQTALSLTAFIVAGGAVALRIGGRAALVSALGLDFTQNPELKDNLSRVLEYTSAMDTGVELALFVLAWTFVKVFCFDAGGVVLALASGVLFGGVWEGAVVSAFAATVGSSVAFGMAKVESPVRKKALEVVEEYPSLRGIEKVVAKDGLKAILTLRLAPVLPIPIGLYNYVYGVTNVPYLDFAGGIFLGSLKPYLLDSYLGVFGKELVEGTSDAAAGSFQDILLLVALGVSVLIGVFASQLANETWESINEEIEREKAERGEQTKEDGVMRNFMGMDLPQWIIGFQLSLKTADKRVNAMIEEEFRAKVWNYTKEELSEGSFVDVIDPASLPTSPEVSGRGKGFDFASSICDGLVLSPALLGAYLKYADPLFDESKALVGERNVQSTEESDVVAGAMASLSTTAVSTYDTDEIESPTDFAAVEKSLEAKRHQKNEQVSVDDLLTVLLTLRGKIETELNKD
eukprot:CCRYP_018445-RA/>CCRYP_018445-RA protein AED:0.36 eAED:0.36 QI:93/0.33/0.25/1/1/1/4/0/578